MDTALEHLESIILVADASESAEAHWNEVCSTIRQLLEDLPAWAIQDIHLLGCWQTVPPNLFSAPGVPFPRQGHSLLAPIVKELQSAEETVQLAIVVGSGTIFDMEDVVNTPWVGRWVFVNAGDEPLRPSGIALSEFDSRNLPALYSWLSTPIEAPFSPLRRPVSGWSNDDLVWSTDKCGFPLVYIPPLDAYVHLFPVAKAQYEAFLPHSPFGDSWYQEVLALNPRLSHVHLDCADYEQLFLTGVLVPEVEAFATWSGRSYQFLTVSEWRSAYCWMQGQPACLPPASLKAGDLSQAAMTLWENLITRLSPPSLLELALLVNGINEWVVQADEYCCLGRTRPAFRQQLLDPLNETVSLVRPSDRHRYIGFRLLRRGI